MSVFVKRNYWLRDNVLKPLFKELWYEKCHMQNLHQVSNDFTFSNVKRLISIYGKTNKQIAEDVKKFVWCNTDAGRYINEFYGYYADYDWVVFCWLFGRMMDLPKPFPMYCRDLKQMLDEKYMLQADKYPNLTRLEAWLQDVKKYPGFPQQTNEHNALSDARWNRDLYYFLQKVEGLQPVIDSETKNV